MSATRLAARERTATRAAEPAEPGGQRGPAAPLEAARGAGGRHPEPEPAAAQVVPAREEEAADVRKPEDFTDWIIYIFHKLSRADFCVIVLGMAAFDVLWILLPLGAIGAQAYWITDLFKRARGWHT